MANNSFNPRKFWDNIDLTKNLFSRIGYISINFRSALLDLAECNEKSISNTTLLRMIIDTINGISSSKVGPIQLRDFYDLNRSLQTYYSEFVAKKKEVTSFDLIDKGFDENKYKTLIRQFSEFLAWGYNYVVPENIKAIYNSLQEPLDEKEMLEDIEKLSLFDLADNPTSRFPTIIIIDNSLYMGEGNILEELHRGLKGLFQEINDSKTLSGAIELYIATCGGGPNEIVNFATIERQEKILSNMTLRPYGRCMMGATINMALDKLEERINLMKNGEIDVAYYCPWMIILSNGKFVDTEELDIAYSRINALKQNRDIQVYPIGLTPSANLNTLKKLDETEASILTSVNGFFSDVFVSLNMSESSTPGGERVSLVHKQGFIK